jgi:hypothetical protein
MLDRQLLQTHFVYKFFLALKGKKERVFLSHFFFCQSCKFLLENPFNTGKNTISESLFLEIQYQQTIFTRQNKWGWTSGVSQAILYVKLFSHNQCFFWVSFVVNPNVAILYRKI